MVEDGVSIREKRIRNLVNIYYSRLDVQKAMLDFARNREVSPRYFEGFGKRPDILEYPGDILAFVKKGATSFHCSEEIWSDPLSVETGMSEILANNLRIGWDLLIDIDSKYIDYSKIMANEIIRVLKFHGVKNIGVKFSGSKGFHLIIPWRAFPDVVNGVKTANMFPEWARVVLNYINSRVKHVVTEKINQLNYKDAKYDFVKKYIRREGGILNLFDKSNNSSLEEQTEALKQSDESVNKEVIPDLVLVSPRHLFRMPYSLHEKTSLASIVIDKDKIDKFELKDADPMKVKVRNFYPRAEEGEARELLMSALDWWSHNERVEKNETVKEFKPIKLDKLSEKNFPPCLLKILGGVEDGKKRAVFILINLFRSIGMEREELEQRIYEWNKKNNPPLREGYLKAQLIWSYRRKPIMPPNCQEFYQGIGVCASDDFCKKIKNPTNYVIRKSLIDQNSEKFEKKKIVKKKVKEKLENKKN